MDTEIVKRETFVAIVAQVNKTREDFCKAIDILETAQKELGVMLGHYRSHILEQSICKEKCLYRIKGNARGFLLQ